MTTITFASATSEAWAAITRAADDCAEKIAALMDTAEVVTDDISAGLFGTSEQIAAEVAAETIKLDELLRAAHALHNPLNCDYPDYRTKLVIDEAVIRMRNAKDKVSR